MSSLTWPILFCLFLVGSCGFSEESHQFNGTYTHFRSKGTTSAKILRQGQDNKWYNFVNGAEILPQQRAKYRVTISKTAKKQNMVGFCTSAVLGNISSHTHAESAYYVGHGTFWEGGVGSSGLVQSGVGDVIECEADLSAGVLRWLRNGNAFKECKVPQKMQGKTVFLSIRMWRAGEEMEMSV